MARPSKHNAEFFPHYKSGGKMRYLIKKHGHEAHAIWMMVLEELTTTDYHHILIESEMQMFLLSDKCMVDESKLIAVIDDLIEMGEFDRELWEDARVIFSERLTDSLSDLYRKRGNDCVKLDELRSKYLGEEYHENGQKKVSDTDRIVYGAETIVSGAETTQSVVKNSIEEKRKEKCVNTHTHARKKFEKRDQKKERWNSPSNPKGEKEKTPPELRGSPLLEMPYDSSEFEAAWSGWRDYLRELGTPYRTKQQEQAALMQLSEYDEEFSIRLIRDSMAKGWKGLVYDKTNEKYQNYLKNERKIIQLNRPDIEFKGISPSIANKLERMHQKYGSGFGGR